MFIVSNKRPFGKVGGKSGGEYRCHRNGYGGHRNAVFRCANREGNMNIVEKKGKEEFRKFLSPLVRTKELYKAQSHLPIELGVQDFFGNGQEVARG